MDNNAIKEGWQYAQTSKNEPQLHHGAEIKMLEQKAGRLRHFTVLYLLLIPECVRYHIPFFRRRNPLVFWLLYERVHRELRKRA